MELRTLRLEQLRNIAAADIELGGGLNLIEGANGAGKTSVLEAVSLISNGVSFRTHRSQDLIAREAAQLRVVATFTSAGFAHRAGYERGRDGSRSLRLDASNVQRQSQISRLMPTLVIAPETFAVVAGGPGGRRRMLDWGLYHRDAGFHPLWSQYRRALAQRNALLRARASPAQLAPWSRELLRWAMPLDAARKSYVAELAGALPAVLEQLSGLPPISLAYRQGWREAGDLADLLDAEATQPRRGQPATRYGPHVAELELLADGAPAREHLSRGQQKLLVYALKLAQLECFHRHRGQGCVVLCDDLPAELDPQRLAQVVALVRACAGQVLMTSATPDAVTSPDRMFHVEHGHISQVI